MKNLEFGFIQGRMTKTPSKNILQYFPKKNWRKEFLYAKKNGFKFIEYFGERRFNKSNPIWNKKNLDEINYLVKKNRLYNYSFCDDYFINNNLLNFKNLNSYFINLSKNLSIIKVKVYVLALFEKSLINKSNILTYVNKLKVIADILSKYKLKLALETNIDSRQLLKLIKKVNRNNIFVVYDTGNRLKRKNRQYEEILKLNKNIIHIHLKDKDWSGKNVILGTGAVNFNSIFIALKSINFKGKFVFETNRGTNPIKTMLNNKNYILKQINEINKL